MQWNVWLLWKSALFTHKGSKCWLCIALSLINQLSSINYLILSFPRWFLFYDVYLGVVLVKCFNLRIHRCSISMVFSLFLRTAYMLLCVQTQYVQITLWCLNFKTVHKGEIQCPPPRLRICSECIRRACFSRCSRKFSPPALSSPSSRGDNCRVPGTSGHIRLCFKSWDKLDSSQSWWATPRNWILLIS